MTDYRVDMGIANRVALVTGAARNIGRSTAIALARAGVRVAVAARTDSKELNDTVRECAQSTQAIPIVVDLADPDSIGAAVGRVERELGPVDILVNNAAIRPRVPIAKIDLAEWANVLDTNLRAPFLLCQSVVEGMMDRRWGRIVNVSGIDAIAGSVDRVHVTTSKGGLLGLTAALAPQVAKYGVTVNTVIPGAIDTVRHTPEWYPDTKTFRAAFTDRSPMARFGMPDEIANAVLFLSSVLSSYLTGQSIVVAGGFPIGRRKESEAEPELDWVGKFRPDQVEAQ
ncbi:MAG: SDR family oxidoreductase [Rhizobiaceae bacterium]|nr:SDR family oxidoreductase [Rhizobiaceae bacterium]